MKTLAVFLLCLLIAAPLVAGPPTNGVYKSDDLGGAMEQGRASESWLPTKFAINNTLNEMSWDGATLGAQWQWVCPWILLPPTLLVDTVDGAGNGQKIWRITYTGGICNLDGGGPWAGGDALYVADIDTWTHTVTETFASFVEVGTVWTAVATSTFRGYNDDCMALQISNGVKIGDTDSGTLPADYPNFWDWATCTDLGTAGPGQWGDISQITLSVTDCTTVSTVEKSWGAVKALYQD